MRKLTVHEAMQSALEGNILTRQSWPEGRFMYAGVPTELSVEETVPNMTSLPPAVKAAFANRGLPTIKFVKQWWVVNENNEISSYIPSPADARAHDFVVVPFIPEAAYEGAPGFGTESVSDELEVGEFPEPTIVYSDEDAAAQAGRAIDPTQEEE